MTQKLFPYKRLHDEEIKYGVAMKEEMKLEVAQDIEMEQNMAFMRLEVAQDIKMEQNDIEFEQRKYGVAMKEEMRLEASQGIEME